MGRHAGPVLGIVFLFVGVVFLAAPDADAGGDSMAAPLGPFAVDVRQDAALACIDGFVNLGLFQPDGELASRMCRPDGFGPVRDAATCDRAGLEFIRTVFFPLASLCAFNGFTFAPGTACMGGTIRVDEVFPGGSRTFAGCALAVLTNEGGASIVAAEPVCIESDTVQGDPTASSLGAGATFIGANGSTYLIAAGQPTCRFNCLSGLDANCDGKPGDYCEPGSDPSVVVDVKICLASLQPASAPSTTAAPATTPALAAESVEVGGLAHTGAETTVLAYIGLAFLGGGMSIMGVRRASSIFQPDSAGH